jgi:hypothetical protein
MPFTLTSTEVKHEPGEIAITGKVVSVPTSDRKRGSLQ